MLYMKDRTIKSLLIVKERKMLNKNRKEILFSIKINLLLLCLAVFQHCTLAYGGMIETRNYPLHLYLDGEYFIATSLYLKCDVIDYKNSLYSDFISKEKGKREDIFKQTIKALRKNSFNDCFYLSHKKKSMKDKEIEDHTRKIKKKMSNFREVLTDETMGSKLEKLKIFSQFYLGDSSFIVFGADDMKANAPYRLMLKFKSDSSGNISWDVEKATEMRFVLQTLVNQMAKSPEKFTQKVDKTFDFEIPLPRTENDHTAYLQFNGKRYNINVSKDAVDPTDEVASLFQQQFIVIKDSREALAELYGGRTREVYLEWLKAGEQYLDWHFKEMATVDRTLRFVLNADPLYVVFYQKEGNDKLMNQFIVRDPQNGQLKFRNLYVLDFFTQWFNSPDIQSSLSDLILDNDGGMSIDN